MYKVSSVVNSSKPIIGYLLQDNYYYYEICRNQSLEQMQILMEYFVESLQMTWGGFFWGKAVIFTLGAVTLTSMGGSLHISSFLEARQCFLHLEQ